MYCPLLAQRVAGKETETKAILSLVVRYIPLSTQPVSASDFFAQPTYTSRPPQKKKIYHVSLIKKTSSPQQPTLLYSLSLSFSSSLSSSLPTAKWSWRSIYFTYWKSAMFSHFFWGAEKKKYSTSLSLSPSSFAYQYSILKWEKNSFAFGSRCISPRFCSKKIDTILKKFGQKKTLVNFSVFFPAILLLLTSYIYPILLLLL